MYLKCYIIFIYISFINKLILSNEMDPMAVWPPELIVSEANKLHDICVPKINISPEIIKKFAFGDVIFEDEKLKCYMHCVLYEAKFADENGNLQIQNMLSAAELLDEITLDILSNMSAGCLKPKGKTACEKSFSFNKCLKLADPKHYILF